jgi:hypothetical protein
MTAPIIRRLRASGIVSVRCLVDALNQHHVATARGGKWHRTSVRRLLARLSGLAVHTRQAPRATRRAGNDDPRAQPTGGTTPLD